MNSMKRFIRRHPYLVTFAASTVFLCGAMTLLISTGVLPIGLGLAGFFATLIAEEALEFMACSLVTAMAVPVLAFAMTSFATVLPQNQSFYQQGPQGQARAPITLSHGNLNRQDHRQKFSPNRQQARILKSLRSPEQSAELRRRQAPVSAELEQLLKSRALKQTSQRSAVVTVPSKTSEPKIPVHGLAAKKPAILLQIAAKIDADATSVAEPEERMTKPRERRPLPSLPMKRPAEALAKINVSSQIDDKPLHVVEPSQHSPEMVSVAFQAECSPSSEVSALESQVNPNIRSALLVDIVAQSSKKSDASKLSHKTRVEPEQARPRNEFGNAFFDAMAHRRADLRSSHSARRPAHLQEPFVIPEPPKSAPVLMQRPVKTDSSNALFAAIKHARKLKPVSQDKKHYTDSPENMLSKSGKPEDPLMMGLMDNVMLKAGTLTCRQESARFSNRADDEWAVSPRAC